VRRYVIEFLISWTGRKRDGVHSLTSLKINAPSVNRNDRRVFAWQLFHVLCHCSDRINDFWQHTYKKNWPNEV